MDFLNDICFPLILFFFYFAIFSAFTPKTATPVTKEEYNPLDDIKRAFSSEFDPEPRSPQPPVQPVILALPPAKPRRRNQVTVLTLPVLITPPTTQPHQEETEMVPSLKSFSIRQLREHIREQNLQSLVKEKLGKTVSKCSKSELLIALA